MARPIPVTRNTDSKGRIVLGKSYANRTMIVEQHGEAIVLRPARVIPERQAWLYENEKSLVSVRRRLEQARAGSFAGPGPDLAAVRALAQQVESATTRHP